MEEYRKKLEKRVIILYVLSALAVIFPIVLIITNGDENGSRGVTLGFFSGMLTVFVINIIRMKRALKDDDILKKMYISDTDERLAMIAKETANSACFIILMCLSVAIVISYCFSPIVAFTLASVLIFIIIVYVAVMTYYNKKM